KAGQLPRTGRSRMRLAWLTPIRFLSCCRWLTVAAVLTGVGFGLYIFLPPTPRWAIQSDLLVFGFVPDGSAVILKSVYDWAGEEQCEPHFTLHDSATGDARGAWRRVTEIDAIDRKDPHCYPD